MSLSQSKPQTIGGGVAVDPTSVLGLDDAARVSAMKAMGAKNVDPPLVRSSHLKNAKTGVIFPWNEMLAEQTEIMVNCDANGNTDPAAWLPTVSAEDISEDERMEMLHARSLSVAQGAAMTRGYEVPRPIPTQNQPIFPEGVVAFDDTSHADIISQEAFNALLERLKGQ